VVTRKRGVVTPNWLMIKRAPAAAGAFFLVLIENANYSMLWEQNNIFIFVV